MGMGYWCGAIKNMALLRDASTSAILMLVFVDSYARLMEW